MREILFRGKRIDNGDWIEGYYVKTVDYRTDSAVHLIIELPSAFYPRGEIAREYEINSSTVGQFTGLTDKNGRKIFEGDIISCGYLCDFFVEYSEEDAEYWANFGDSIGSLHTYFDPKRATVIGSIYDNPELLEVTE